LIATEIASVVFPLNQINRRLSIKILVFFPTERAYRFDFMPKASLPAMTFSIGYAYSRVGAG
jgi:hypothetical protein